MADTDEVQSLCKTCKYGLCVTTVEGDDIEVWQFCSVLGTPIKFTGGKKTIECTAYTLSKKK